MVFHIGFKTFVEITHIFSGELQNNWSNFTIYYDNNSYAFGIYDVNGIQVHFKRKINHNKKGVFISILGKRLYLMEC